MREVALDISSMLLLLSNILLTTIEYRTRYRVILIIIFINLLNHTSYDNVRMNCMLKIEKNLNTISLVNNNYH
jgi:hypothetical protein